MSFCFPARKENKPVPTSSSAAIEGSGTGCIAMKFGALKPPTAYVETEPPGVI
jgi:hypothetical protein